MKRNCTDKAPKQVVSVSVSFIWAVKMIYWWCSREDYGVQWGASWMCDTWAGRLPGTSEGWHVWGWGKGFTQIPSHSHSCHSGSIESRPGTSSTVNTEKRRDTESCYCLQWDAFKWTPLLFFASLLFEMTMKSWSVVLEGELIWGGGTTRHHELALLCVFSPCVGR